MYLKKKVGFFVNVAETLDVKNCLSKANTRIMYKNKVLAGSFKSISKSIKWKC